MWGGHFCPRVHGTFLSRVPEPGDRKVARTGRQECLPRDEPRQGLGFINSGNTFWE